MIKVNDNRIENNITIKTGEKGERMERRRKGGMSELNFHL